MEKADLDTINKIVSNKLKEIFPGIEEPIEYKLIFSSEGRFVEVECGKVRIEADHFDLSFI